MGIYYTSVLDAGDKVASKTIICPNFMEVNKDKRKLERGAGREREMEILRLIGIK